MTSLTRKMLRARLGAKEFKNRYPRPSQPVSFLKDGGYVTIHPTKGRRRISGKRLRAQRRMAHILDRNA